MAKEWIDPRYVELVAAWRAARTAGDRAPEPRPVKAFIVPPKA
ncbi:hypothetical protein ABZY19_35925 [Streptomyces sp. NPDC006475]|uniref:Uncharacterized protein n=1 Tax=Streptomyces achmelvichensis TaxID=3134111 RepID=A0ACC6PX87_9ACTN|nr:hypothetical protein OG317_17750 [Streptomyces sp. NBC_01167]